MTDAERMIYTKHTGRGTPPVAPAREVWCIAGRRAGKSRVASLLAVFVAAFRDYAGCLAPGEKATVAVIAADRQQARVVFRYICGLLDAVPMLRALVERQTVDTYGRWLKMRDTAAADRLDTLPVSEPVSAGTSS